MVSILSDWISKDGRPIAFLEANCLPCQNRSLLGLNGKYIVKLLASSLDIKRP